MPTVFLKPTGETDIQNVISTGALTDVDEGVTSPDAALETSIVNAWAGVVVYDLEDLPGDADSINSYTLRVRAQIGGGRTDDSVTNEWDAIGTGIIISPITWIFINEDGDPLADKTGIGSGTPTVAQINAAQIQVEQTVYTQSMAPDGAFHAWDCFELEVDYAVAGAAFNPALLKTPINVIRR